MAGRSRAMVGAHFRCVGRWPCRLTSWHDRCRMCATRRQIQPDMRRCSWAEKSSSGRGHVDALHAVATISGRNFLACPHGRVWKQWVHNLIEMAAAVGRQHQGLPLHPTMLLTDARSPLFVPSNCIQADAFFSFTRFIALVASPLRCTRCRQKLTFLYR